MILLNLEKDQFYLFKTGPFLGNEDSEVVSGEIENIARHRMKLH